MRTLKLLALGVLFIVGAPPAVNAQTRRLRRRSRFFFNVSFGGQWNDQTFTDTQHSPSTMRSGAVAAAHSIGGGTLFDIGAGARVWKSVGIGIGYSTISNKNDATVSVSVPHPVIFGQSRTATATAAGSRAL